MKFIYNIFYFMEICATKLASRKQLEIFFNLKFKVLPSLCSQMVTKDMASRC